MEQEPGFARTAQGRSARRRRCSTSPCKLEGMARNAGVHAAGVVISPVPLKELVPLYKTNKDEIVTQYDMGGLEKLGLLKMDFLGLTTLTIIDDALELIEKHRGVNARSSKISRSTMPRPTRSSTKGFTSGVFQFESRGHARYSAPLPAGPHRRSVALNALYRPGPIRAA